MKFELNTPLYYTYVVNPVSSIHKNKNKKKQKGKGKTLKWKRGHIHTEHINT